ncbi:MAG: cupredoxin domain-containing protein [Candidatus Thermoplasmatota archaeon]|jgi:plastocyanin
MRGLAAGLLLGLVMIAGCSDSSDDGDSSSSSSSTSTTTGPAPADVGLAIASVGAYPVNPSFDPSTASVPAGAVVHVSFSNNDVLPIQHNIVVEGIPGAASDTIGSGDQSAFNFIAPDSPGEFTFYCAIGDHRERGMEGTLTVTA